MHQNHHKSISRIYIILRIDLAHNKQFDQSRYLVEKKNYINLIEWPKEKFKKFS